MVEGFLLFVSVPIIFLGMLVLFFWSIYLIERGRYIIKDSDKTEKSIAEPTAHFLVPAEEGFGEK